MPDLLNMASNIIKLYIEASAPMSINLSAKVRAKTEAAVRDGQVDRSTFELAANEIYQVMSRDSFARFKNTDLWGEFKLNPRKLPKDLPKYFNSDFESGVKTPVTPVSTLASGPSGLRSVSGRERSHVSKKRVSVWCAGKRNRTELRSFLYSTGDIETAHVEGSVGGLRVIILTPQTRAKQVVEDANAANAAKQAK